MSDVTEQSTQDFVNVEVPRLTPEQVLNNQTALEDAIELAIQQFVKGQDPEVLAAMSDKEKAYTQLLDPLVWVMREFLETYMHDCADCIERRETDGNNLGVAIAEIILGSE